MYYIVSLSGGVASAVAAERVIQRAGRKRVVLRFADTSWEDEDLYRFLGDCMKRWGGKLYVHRDGRTPLDVAEERSIIPNNNKALCSYELKIKPFAAWLWRMPKPVTVCLGLDWREPQRIERIQHWHKRSSQWRRPTGYARRIPGVYEDFPLLWKPIEFTPYVDVVRSWGITPPRLYALGFPHNNCAGRCVKQGIAEWQRLQVVFPERFAEMRDWEQAQRAKGGPRANAAICIDQSGYSHRPLTLAEIEQRRAPVDADAVQDDMFSCFCSSESEP